MRKIILTALSMFVLLLAVGVVSASVIYNSIDNPLPGSYPSLGYAATSTDALGDQIIFSGTDRELTKVTVTLTDWACENDFTWETDHWVANRDGYAGEACITTPGTGFNHPITLNIYEVDKTDPSNPTVGDLIATKTETFNIKYRPSWDSENCVASGQTPDTNIPFGGKWYDPVLETCVSGYNQNIEFDLTSLGVTLPDEVIFAVAYNTGNYGEEPIGMNGPYNSLNYGLSEGALVGTDVEPDALFWDTTFTGYTDGLKRDTGWSGYVPTAKFEAYDSSVIVPEFGAIVAMLTAIGALGVFFVIRRR